MRYEESININGIDYYFIFTDEASTTSLPNIPAIFFAKENVGNICDNWSVDTEQDILMELCQLSVNWVNLNYRFLKILYRHHQKDQLHDFYQIDLHDCPTCCSSFESW